MTRYEKKICKKHRDKSGEFKTAFGRKEGKKHKKRNGGGEREEKEKEQIKNKGKKRK